MKDLIINKSAFPFYTDYWQQYFSRLSGEQCKEVLRVVCHFNQFGEQEKHDDFAVDMVANSIITNVIRDAKKREKRIIASQNNGARGGRPSKTRTKPEKPDTPKVVKPTLQEIKDYCSERKNRVNPEKFFDHYESNGWKVGKNSMKNWKAAVRKWEGSDFNAPQAKDDLASQINQIAGDDYVLKVFESEGVTKIKCKSPTSKAKLYELAAEKKDKIKALFKGNLEFIC